VEYEDRISIATPEGIELEVTLAGVGSRFVALLVDQFIQWSIVLAVALAIGLGASGADSDLGGTAGNLLAALLILTFFFSMFGYPVLFETLASGRTPGKRATGLRVVDVGGRPIGFRASAIRNVIRVVDVLPGMYLVGIVAILASKKNQRLGDMAANTVVVMERTGGRVSKRAAPAWQEPRDLLEPSPEAATWDVSAVTGDELSTIRQFLLRRGTLTPDARARLAHELALRLRPKVVGPPDDMHPEELLLEVAALKATRG
jgi:uncharacterized RDD family membrane protein YckC